MRLHRSELAATPPVDYPCGGTSLTVCGRREALLQDGGILLKKAGLLLKVGLSR